MVSPGGIFPNIYPLMPCGTSASRYGWKGAWRRNHYYVECRKPGRSARGAVLPRSGGFYGRLGKPPLELSSERGPGAAWRARRGVLRGLPGGEKHGGGEGTMSQDLLFSLGRDRAIIRGGGSLPGGGKHSPPYSCLPRSPVPNSLRIFTRTMGDLFTAMKPLLPEITRMGDTGRLQDYTYQFSPGLAAHSMPSSANRAKVGQPVSGSQPSIW